MAKRNTARAGAKQRTTSLETLIIDKRLRALAGDKYYERGAEYFASGAVTSLVDSGETVVARVVGTDEYKVVLKVAGRDLDWNCTCPLGEEGEFCKHVVATGLAWLATRGQDSSAGQDSTVPDYTGKGDLDAVRSYLAGMSHEALAALILEQVAEDDVLRSRLGAQAARRTTDPKALKDTVRKALAVSGFVGYHGMRALIQRALTVTDLLRGLIADGNATLAAELAAYAMQRGLTAYVRTDDSSGSFGGVLHSIAALHLEACRKTQPLSDAFAGSFFDLKRRDDWRFFEWKDYAPLFSDAGRAAYRALAEEEWAKVPARAPGEGGRHFATEHFVITHVMEDLAREAGDIDGLVAVKSRDLSSPYVFLQIAEILVEADRSDDALAWAERGHAAFRRQPDMRLVEFLIKEYRTRKRFDDAVNVAWEYFVAAPGRRAFALLKHAAKDAKSATAWRDKAIAWVRENCIEEKGGNKSRARASWWSGGHSLLVEIHLDEGDSDAALAEARAGGCPEHLWFEIARAREKNHPADASEIYRAAIDGIVGRANNSAYDDAVELIAKVRELMRRTRNEGEFAAWIEAVRTKHRAKRNFMQRLERVVGKAE